MTALLDTSVLVRYLVGAPAEQAATARSLIDGEEAVSVPVVGLAEAAFVLTRRYGIGRGEVVDALVGLLRRANVSVNELPTELAVQALLLCRPSGRISFADALIWAAARSSPSRRVVTFDRRFPELDIERKLLPGRGADPRM